MEVVLYLVTLGDGNVERILVDPPLVWKVIAPDDDELYEEARRQETPPPMFSRLVRRARAAPSSEPFEIGGSEGIRVDLDTAWDGIRYLLTSVAGNGPPLNFLLMGGEVVPADAGDGPVRVFTAEETKIIHIELSRISDDTLVAAFDAKDMMAEYVYPEGWTRDSLDQSVGYLLEYLHVLRRFLAQAVDENVGMLVYLS